VTIAHQFAVGEYALTFAQWDACVSDGGCKGYKPGDESQYLDQIRSLMRE